MTSNSLNDLRYFLKEMFQFNFNDLDFGIYKIYNLKRRQIEQFIDGDGENDLEAIIAKTLKDVSLEELKNEAIELRNYLKGYSRENLLDAPKDNYAAIQTLVSLEPDETKKAVLTQALEKSLESTGIDDKLKDQIYNHILGFFQMYYSNGDFGYNNRSRELYKVPYEADYDGSDTLFHWKHKGSLYIKTGASFNAVKFDFRGKKLEFRLESNDLSQDEEVAQNNNKDLNLKHYQFNRIEEVDSVQRVVFNIAEKSTPKAEIYKAIYEQIFEEADVDKYLIAEKTKTVKGEKVAVTEGVFNDLTDDFDKVQGGAVKGLSALRISKKALAAAVKPNFERGTKLYDEGNNEILDTTLADLYTLDHKLNSFYIGHDADYFIHEDLHGFLSKEKERYVKNYIFHDLQAIYSGKLDNSVIVVAKAFDLISSRIIDFLAAIEEFQKDIFTRKKKVVESEYCLTIDNINPDYYSEILANTDQIEAWQELFKLEVNSLEILQSNPTLVLDTRFFRQLDGSNPFKDKILAEVENLDERTVGLLINSENYQGLNLMEEKYRGIVDCIHIDPPYNSNTSGFLYKNSFRHSSWISMMENRLSKSFQFLKKDGSLLCHIDENEYENLRQLIERYNFPTTGTLIWDKRNPMNGGSGLALQHEYVIWSTNSSSPIHYRNESAVVMLKKAEALIKVEGEVNENVRKEFSKWVNSNKDLTGGDKAYKYIDDKGQVYQSVSLRAPEPREDEKFFQPLIHPITGKPCAVPPNGFSRTPDTLKKMIDADEILFGPDESTQPRQKVTLKSEVKKQMPSILQDAKKGKAEIGAMGLTFPYNHSISVYDKLIATAIGETDGYVFDFFAGSGTSGHSVININKIGDRKIKYLLVEMGTYFDVITKPRIQKVIFSSYWKAGSPASNKGSINHIFKYLVLEQYEDILDHIEAWEGDYPPNLPLKYLYRPELNRLNDTLDLSRPFSNKIQYGKPSKEGFVDVVDTYNYLMGYHLQSLKTYTIGGKYYKVAHAHNTLVVWRNIALNEDDVEATKEIVGKYEGIAQVEVNYYFELIKEADKFNTMLINGQEVHIQIIQQEVFNR